MRKLLVVILSLFTAQSFAQSGQEKNNLFQCMSGDEFTINADCVSSSIDTDIMAMEFNQTLTSNSTDIGGKVMSTLVFYPDLMEIHVIAIPETPQSGFAMLNTQHSDIQGF